MDNLYLLYDCPVIGEPSGYISPRKGSDVLAEKGLTIVHPFYNERNRFELQYNNWAKWSNFVRDRVRVTLIDDGSPDPVHTYITKHKHLNSLNFDIYRIEQNLKWNTPGALNLGLTVAPTEWVLIMDSDCAFNSDNMETLLTADLEPNAVYKFPRQRLGNESEDTANRRYLPCTMLMHKSLIWKFGGFDEDFTGEHSGGYAFFDSDFDLRIKETREHPCFIWNNITATEWMPSKTKGEIVQRSKADEKINRKLFHAKTEARGPESYHNPSPILRFPWKRTYHNERV